MEKIKIKQTYWPKFDLFMRDSAFVPLWGKTVTKLVYN